MSSFETPRARNQGATPDALLPALTSEPAELTLSQRRDLLLDIRHVAAAHHPGGYEALVQSAHGDDQRRSAILAKYDREQAELAALKERASVSSDSLEENRTETARHNKSFRAKALSLLRLHDTRLASLEEIGAELEASISAMQARIAELHTAPNPHSFDHSLPPSFEASLQASSQALLKTPLSPDEIRSLVTPELVESLSLEDYIALWRRMDARFLSHVTRHGVRDHIGMFYHSAGVGEFHDGISGMLSDSLMLRPPLIAGEGLLDYSPERVKKYLERYVLKAEDAPAAHARLHKALNFSLAAAPPYPDKTAVHFGAQAVLDTFYGAETGNSPFFVIPTALVASRYPFAFNGWHQNFEADNESMWNDVFVWAGQGLSLNQGILFLPKSASVDPETGSRYKLEQSAADPSGPRTACISEELPNRFSAWCSTLGGSTTLQALLRDLRASSADRYPNWTLQDQCRTAIAEALQALGFSRDDVGAVTARLITWAPHALKDDGTGFTDDVAPSLISTFSLMYQRAPVTVSSEAYWRSYFLKHPEQEPKRVVFYEGDPTEAVFLFRNMHGISEESMNGDFFGRRSRPPRPPLLGFDDNHVTNMSDDPRALAGFEELKAVAAKVIDEHYR